ncbi:MAG: hypothetical protein ACFCUX_00705 [Candidatus Methylacidiphilales bacterium]
MNQFPFSIKELALSVILCVLVLFMAYPIIRHYWMKGTSAAETIRNWEANESVLQRLLLRPGG